MAERSSVASPDGIVPARRRLGSEPETGAGGYPASIKVVQPQGGLAAKRGLVDAVGREIVRMNSRGVVPFLLNLGAGSDVSIENQLRRAGATRFVVDRVDLELTVVEQANVRRQWQGNVEELSEITSDSYDLAFANYVIEHVKHVSWAVGEMARVVRPGGLIVLTVPNPSAPEFKVAARSPRWLRQVFHPRGFEAHYGYGSVAELVRYLDAAGVHLETTEYSPEIGDYLKRASKLAGHLGNVYDSSVARLHARRLCGHVLLAARKA